MTAPPLTLQHRPARVTVPCHFLFGEDSPLTGVIDQLDPDSPNLESGTVTGVKHKPTCRGKSSRIGVHTDSGTRVAIAEVHRVAIDLHGDFEPAILREIISQLQRW